ncbi:F0F1 ATP synthase subunit epsilon [Leuconostoc fallax]|uniref:ATP synthase epsilon chain n=1 Tax=Leuconostoc fallax TaxID=1251 RepID=A0A4R5N9P1_9LACO|nr:F0F1 ATP synthase subunit epsilon [Leuconostoc fallax]MBU7456006.1 F0F1 ATP synthase subunit epsilon [Leuconostoc fallax]MCO6184314.1 F0F1 ATP synthase subunit epsilon [Leuconostoc fallax]TDG68850.1 hypothetical protein C5L23_000769 [Leuconostoc fallax]
MADETTTQGIQVQIVTPEGDVYNEQSIEIATVNTKGGQFGLMRHHEPVLAALDINELLVKKDGKTVSLAVNGGFAEFSNNVLTVVADSAETSDKIDVNRAQSARDRAETRIQHAQEVHNEDELKRARVALMRAVNRIHVAAAKQGK